MINHPSYTNTECLEHDVRMAVLESAKTGEKVTLRYSEEAARMLFEICDWESEKSYSYRGTTANDRPWYVVLTER